MRSSLKLTVGQHSDKGRKEVNQDFHGVILPEEPALTLKGVAIALADGVSASPVSRVAAESAVKSFLTDYFATPESWSVKTSASRVIAAVNSWLHAQTRRGESPHNMDRGYVCTLSALVIKGGAAHIFHVGDSRIYRIAGRSLEQLTRDHRISLSSEQTYLARALGATHDVEIDYRAVPLAEGDVFLLATDGVYEHIDAPFVAETLADCGDDLDQASMRLVSEAYARGSADNLTAQIVRVDRLGAADVEAILGQARELPPPPALGPRMECDGYHIIRPIHVSSRSHIFLAEDSETGTRVALKTPSVDLRDDPSYCKRFMMEEWVARRIDSAHVVKASPPSRRRNYLYAATEFVEGQTLAQWMVDNPRPDLQTTRDLIEQIARGLQAFHRQEMLHQDLRPANIMIDRRGTAKIIDFGSVRIAGVSEVGPAIDDGEMLGAVQYAAPEYFLGDIPTPSSDLYSLGAIAYQMLSGRLPYGGRVAATRSRAQQRKLRYEPVADDASGIPAWVDAVLEKALAIESNDRFAELSEFVFALRNPAELIATRKTRPLLERNPLLFWKLATLLLGAATFVLALARCAGV